MDLRIRHAVAVMDPTNRVDSVASMLARVSDALQSEPESETKGAESNG